MKIAWTHRPSDFGKPEYGVRRAKAIESHLSAIICEPQGLRQLFDLWLRPSDELGLYLGGRRPEHIQVARQLIAILPSASIVEMLRYLVEDYWGRRSGWPDLFIFRDNEFFFAEVKSATDKLGKSHRRTAGDGGLSAHSRAARGQGGDMKNAMAFLLGFTATSMPISMYAAWVIWRIAEAI
jgi:hypothetical protein